MGRIAFEPPDGGECPAFYVSPTRAIVLQASLCSRSGGRVDEHMRDIAARLATSGYRALVPDFYPGKVTLETAEDEHLMGALDFRDAASRMCAALLIPQGEQRARCR